VERVVRRADGRLSQATRLPSGALRIPAALTRTGVLEYKRADGTVQRELRLDDEVFAEDSLATLRGADVTDLHPPGMVGPDNYREYARGVVGDNVRKDGDLVVADVLVKDARLIAAVERGDREEISCGYSCDLEFNPGTYQGKRYDAVQRSIEYNHAALGPKGWGRAGGRVSLRLDAAGNQLPDDEHKPSPADRRDSMATVRIDGVDFDPATPAFAQAFAKHQERADALEKENAELKAEVSKQTGRADAAEEKVKKIDGELTEAKDPKRLDSLAKERADLLEQARPLLAKDEKLDGLTDAEIRRKVVEASSELKLDGKDDGYIQAVFDTLVAQGGGTRQDASDDANRRIRRDSGGGGSRPKVRLYTMPKRQQSGA